MKTKRVLVLSSTLVILILLSGFSSPQRKMNTAYSISLSSTPVVGDTEYDIRVTYASGNHAYKLTMITGFMILSKNPVDINAGGYTVFHIKTYPMVTHIVGRIDAWVCSPSCTWTDYQNFAF
jgi:hypothetical protein